MPLKSSSALCNSKWCLNVVVEARTKIMRKYCFGSNPVWIKTLQKEINVGLDSTCNITSDIISELLCSLSVTLSLTSACRDLVIQAPVHKKKFFPSSHLSSTLAVWVYHAQSGMRRPTLTCIGGRAVTISATSRMNWRVALCRSVNTQSYLFHLMQRATESISKSGSGTQNIPILH